MRNKDIAAKFRLLAALMELHGDNPFKIRSYETAARTIEQQPTTLNHLTEPQIEALPGIGKAIAGKINSLLNTGSFDLLDRMLAKTPAGVVEILGIKGLGPKKVKALWQELGIENVGELLYACQENRLLLLKGFGEKVQENTKKAVDFYLANARRYRFADVEPDAQKLYQWLAEQPFVEQIAFTGPMRRKCEIIDQIDLLLIANWEQLIAFCEQAQCTHLLLKPDELTAHTPHGLPFTLHSATQQNWAYRLALTTAAAAHLQQLYQIGLTQTAATTEAEVYQNLGLAFIEPEMREGLNEISLAKHNQLPTLLQEPDITGIIHAHTTYSDGRDTLQNMAKACIAAGYQYLGVTDHSKAAFYANGLSEQQIIKQHLEIDQLNAQLAPFTIFKGIEADILNDGNLDYSPDVLQTFDFVIASIHSNLQMDETKATNRLIKAIENPHTTILGHPTGRLLLSRAGYPIHHQKVIDACAANKVIIEINANPYRLDIDWRWIPYCLEKGVMLSVNPDAHNLKGISDVRYGVLAARKGGLSKAFTLNALPLPQVAAALKKQL